VRLIFCEHFIEHLRFDDGVRFLQNCLKSLRGGDTPNLDYVYLTHYRVGEPEPDRRSANAFMLNRAFYGWGHQFLYNETLLRQLLEAIGFSGATACRYGESSHEELRGLERHERPEHTSDLPDVVVLEAKKGHEPHEDSEPLQVLLRKADEGFLRHLQWRLARGLR